MEADIYPWQNDYWNKFLILKKRLPNAILFYGNTGIGKLNFSYNISKSLLCKNLTEKMFACNICSSCILFKKNNHPDFRFLRPEFNEIKATENKKKDSLEKVSSIIKIEQVRSLTNFLNLSTHRLGHKIILIYPSEKLTTYSANALLKILEEPTGDTLFLLVCHSIDKLPLTIRSRCHLFHMKTPKEEFSTRWLEEKGIKNVELKIKEFGGSPLSLLESLTSDKNYLSKDYIEFLTNPNKSKIISFSEKNQKIPLEKIILWHQKWIYDLFFFKVSGRTVFFPAYQDKLKKISLNLTMDKILFLINDTSKKKLIVSHPISQRLFVEELMLCYFENCFE